MLVKDEATALDNSGCDGVWCLWCYLVLPT